MLGELALAEKPINYTNARKWFTKYVEIENSGKLRINVGEVNEFRVYFLLASFALNGLGGPVDIDAAFTYFNQLAIQGVPPAQAAIAQIMSTPEYEDYYKPSDALAWAVVAKINGNETPSDRIATIRQQLNEEELESSFNQVIAMYKTSIKRHKLNSDAKGSTSVQFYINQQIKEPEDALRWLENEATEDFPNYYVRIARLFSLDNDIEKDLSKARKIYLSGAEAGDIPSIANFARFAKDGTGGKRNLEEARKWYGVLVENNDLDAMRNLADLYRTGRGGDINIPEAIKLYNSAAQKGIADAQVGLATIYSDEKLPDYLDYEQAYFWAILSDINGRDYFEGNAKRIKANLSEDTIKKTHSIIADYYEKRLTHYTNKTLDENNQDQLDAGVMTIKNHVFARSWLRYNAIE